MELNSKMNVYAVDKGADFGTAIGKSGVLSGIDLHFLHVMRLPTILLETDILF